MDEGKPKPAVRRRRKSEDKPPMPAALVPHVAAAKARHLKRHASPGVDVEVNKLTPGAYVVDAPFADRDAWQVLLCDAIGTRSESTARTFVTQLTQLCSLNWEPAVNSLGGEWCPDETQLNMILNIIASVKPKNEMQAMLAAQMVAVHLMQMRASEHALRNDMLDERTAAVADKLARTFAMQIDALGKMQGKRTTRQKITVRYERHDHQHVHIDQGGAETGAQPHATESKPGVQKPRTIDARPDDAAQRASLPGPDAGGSVVSLPRRHGQAGL